VEGKEALHNLLSSTLTVCTILLSNSYVDLEHGNEATISTMLLTGSMVYIIWLRSQHNLNLLETAYDNFADLRNP
jgi:hypothetical protein